MTTIDQANLRRRFREILSLAEAGQEFVVTVDGRPVARLGPCGQRQWIPKAEILALLRPGAPDPTFFDEIQEIGERVEELRDPWDR